MNAAHVAKLLGGDVAGRGRVLCPGPGHSPKDRSISVTLAGRDFIVHSFAGDDWQACKDHVRALIGQGGVFLKEKAHGAPALVSDDEVERTARAVSIWGESRPIAGTPAEAYLKTRGVAYDGEALRWHPSCPFGKGTRVGAMIALVRDVRSDEPKAIHRTAIDRDGRKLAHLGSNGRMALGPTAGGAVKLYAPDCGALGIGEGIESSLSIRGLRDLDNMPVWSLLNAGQLAAFPALPGLSGLWVAMDNDPAGRRAAGEIVVRMAAASIETVVLASKTEGADLNDIGRVHAES